ncbi:MAG TPA: zinc-dependent alcohol dehydrogenase [Solirubrobacteraceae bacterium]|jgi:threonine dehydrogenase-like Zn-dependent dehydrogenase|nr:zinc-dependent alcohol dehydrogenase [Solirubrobacteraceae bacterium]
MRANTWQGRNSVEVQDVPDPKILNQRDAIVKVTSSAICGSDLHLYDGYIPTMKRGDVIGHEFMGEVVDVGREVTNLRPGDRVVVPFPIACGNCNACAAGLWAACENSNPNAGIAEKAMGHSPCGIFGYSHMMGGFAGGQAEAVRVPFADVGPLKVPDGVTDEQALFLSDVFPTGFMGAEMCDVEPHDVVAVWGAGPVGLFAAVSAFLLGAHRVIVIDRFDYRLQLAREKVGAETINYVEAGDVPETLKEMTGGRGPDKVIEAVGMEAHHQHGIVHAYDRVKQATRQETERPHAVREAILSVRNGGIVSIVGVFGGVADKFPLGAVVNRGLTIRAGQCHVHRYLRPLMDRIVSGEVDPTFIITHTVPLEEAPTAFETFKHKQDECVKVVLKP